jgi:hypothetical protein
MSKRTQVPGWRPDERPAGGLQGLLSGLLRAPGLDLSVAALILANLAPLAGALFVGWDGRVVVLLYWVENLVVGFYAILKMALARVPKPSEQLKKLLLIPFFCVHFGGFCAIHGMFLLVLFKVGGELGPPPFAHWLGPLVFFQLLFWVVSRLWESLPPGMLWCVAGLVVSHGVSFVQNYLLGREYATLTPDRAMVQPYGRIVLMHVTILAGAAPVVLLGSPVPLLSILVLLKTAVDVLLHAYSHRLAGTRAVTAGVGAG